MDARIKTYRLFKDEVGFEYFSVFDNNLEYLTYNWIEKKTKLSVMELDLLQDDKDMPQLCYKLSGIFVPLKKLLSDETRSGDYLLLDFSNTGVQLNNLEMIIDLPQRYKMIYFYQLGQSETEELNKKLDGKGVLFDLINDSLFSIRAASQTNDKLFTKDDDIKEIIQRGLAKVIFDEISRETKKSTTTQEGEKTEETTPNEGGETGKYPLVYSSNIFSNRYINMRQVFSNNDKAMLITTCILHKMMDIKNLEFDAFICASITGACIASFLSVYIKKPVLFLRNVGPDIKTEDDLIVERIYPHKNYVYIFDFMCLGTELLRTKLICALKSSTIIKSFGISHYQKPSGEKDEDIQTLFSINEFSSDYYKCGVTQQDLDILMGEVEKNDDK